MGYGAILRDHDGGLLVGRCQSNRGGMVMEILLIEAMAMLFGAFNGQLKLRWGQIVNVDASFFLKQYKWRERITSSEFKF